MTKKSKLGGANKTATVETPLGEETVAVTPGEEDIGATGDVVVRDYDDLVRADAERLYVQENEDAVLTFDETNDETQAHYLQRAQKLRDGAENGAGKMLYDETVDPDQEGYLSWEDQTDEVRQNWIEAVMSPGQVPPITEPPMQADTPQVRETPARNNEAADGTNTSNAGADTTGDDTGATGDTSQAATVNVHKGDQMAVADMTKNDQAAYGIDPSNWAEAFTTSLQEAKPADMESYLAFCAMWFNRAINSALSYPIERSEVRDRFGEVDDEQSKFLFGDDYVSDRRVKLTPDHMNLSKAKVLATASLTERREGTMHGSIDDLVVPY